MAWSAIIVVVQFISKKMIGLYVNHVRLNTPTWTIQLAKNNYQLEMYVVSVVPYGFRPFIKSIY